MTKISKVSAIIVRSMVIAVWQKLVTVDDAFYKIYEHNMDMSDETAGDIREVLEFTLSRKYTCHNAVEEIIELIEE